MRGHHGRASRACITGVLTIPVAVADIGAGAFQGCKAIVAAVSDYETVELDDYAVSECSGMLSVALDAKAVTV